jgi:two-component system response regulator RpaA
MLVEVLERDGRFEVLTATTGFDAGLRTREFLPDVIVLDYMLPDINGNAVCRSIRSDESLRDVKIIIVSGVVNREDVEKLLEDGADDFLQKPFSIEQLVKRITELVRGA